MPIKQMITAVLIFCLVILPSQKNRNFYGEVKENNIKIENKQYLRCRNENNVANIMPYYVEINYPVVSGLPIDITQKINHLIKKLAFTCTDDKLFDEKLISMEKDYQNKKCFHNTVSNYHVFLFTDQILSLMYTVQDIGHITQYIATLDLNTGDLIYLNDLIDPNQLIDAIKNGDFEIYEGMYSELENEDPDNLMKILIPKFVVVIQNALEHDEDTKHYDLFSFQNIGIDKDSLYVCFLFDDSLNGRMILKVPLQKLIIKENLIP